MKFARGVSRSSSRTGVSVIAFSIPEDAPTDPENELKSFLRPTVEAEHWLELMIQRLKMLAETKLTSILINTSFIAGLATAKEALFRYAEIKRRRLIFFLRRCDKTRLLLCRDSRCA